MYFFDGWRVHPTLTIPSNLPRTKEAPVSDIARAAPPATREALLSEAGFEKVFRTQNWVRRSKLFCRWFCFLLGQAGCISVAA